MEKLIRQRLDECHLNYPSYGERSTGDIETIARMFSRHLVEFNERQICQAFDYHLRTKDRFPTIADIRGALDPVKLYQFDGGPKGFGAVYHADHPYVRLQERIGLENMDKYAVYVPRCDGSDPDRLRIEASAAPAEDIDNTVDLPGSDRSGGSGFKRISYATEEQWDELNDNLKGFAR